MSILVHPNENSAVEIYKQCLHAASACGGPPSPGLYRGFTPGPQWENFWTRLGDFLPAGPLRYSPFATKK